MTLHNDPDLATPLERDIASMGTPIDLDEEFANFGDYFGFDERGRWFFPDGKQWIEYKKLNEGDRQKFVSATRTDLHVNRQTGEARLPVDQSRERMQLLLTACTNWYVAGKNPKDGKRYLVPFRNNGSDGCEFAQWLKKADPAILADLEKEIRKFNPWMMGELSVEQIDKEIADLQELREAAAKREANEKNS